MDYELIFSAAGLLAMLGWAVLLFSPLIPAWSNRIAGLIIPVLLSAGYLLIILLLPAKSGGFGSFAEVRELFANPEALMAGWVHFLAFDLFVGAWICEKGRSEHIRFWMVLPCLPVTFLFGPAGYLLFSAIRAIHAATGQKAERSGVLSQ